MLNFSILFQALLICAVLYLFFLVIRKLKERVDILVKSGSGNVLSDLAFLKMNKDEGAGFDVRLTADNKKSIGNLVIKDEKCWVYVPKGTESYSSDSNGYRKIGYVNPEGYIFLSRKGSEPERIGYLARPSKPSEPSIKGERSWKNLWWKSRLNVYFGDPEAWSDSTTITPSVVVDSKQSKLSSVTVEAGGKEENGKMELSFAAVPPERNIVGDNEQVEEEKGGSYLEGKEANDEETQNIGIENNAEEVASVVNDDNSDSGEMGEPEVVVEGGKGISEETKHESEENQFVTEDDEANVLKGGTDFKDVQEDEITEAINKEPDEIGPAAKGEQSDIKHNDEGVTYEKVSDVGYQITEQEAAYLQQVKEKYPDILSQIRQEMVKVEGGSFIMGVSDSDNINTEGLSESNEGPAHKVTLDSFCIGRYPVTQKIWTAIMGYNNSIQLSDDFPVAPVDWNESMLFVNRLNALTGLKFSLPTEAQWEFAARGGNLSNGYVYSGSNIKGHVAWDNQYSPVGKKKPNELGIYDMSGLVREWCIDWYATRYPSEEQYNPMGPAMPEDPLERKRVIRSPYGNETVTNRKGELPDNPKHFMSYGLRLVCEPDKSLGKRVKPVLVGQSVKSGFLGGSPESCPVTDEARGGAYVLFYSQYGKNTYSEFVGRSPYSWTDTALLSSLVFSIAFLILYFFNTAVLQMPLLGNDLKAIVTLTTFYFVIWAAVRAIKIEAVENGHSFQPLLDLMNKSVGHRNFDMIAMILGYLCTVWTYFFYDADFMPLIFAISLGLTINRTNRRAADPWVVVDPLKSEDKTIELDIDGDNPEKRIPAPDYKNGVTRHYNWKLDSFEGKEIKAHLSMMFDPSDVSNIRLKNPFYLEKPNLDLGDYKNYLKKMRRDLKKDDKNLYHTKYALQEIKRISTRYELSEIDTLQFILDFIQESIKYQLDNECRELAMPTEYIRYPDEILYDQQGDCDCKAFLAMVMYYQLGYDVIFLISRQIGHAALAVAVKDSVAEQYLSQSSLEDVTVEINGTKYYFCETTTDGFRFGDIQNGLSVDQFETRIEWKHTNDEED